MNAGELNASLPIDDESAVAGKLADGFAADPGDELTEDPEPTWEDYESSPASEPFAKTVPSATEFRVPPGYHLIPDELYQVMVAGMANGLRAPVAVADTNTKSENLKSFKIRMLRQCVFGDIPQNVVAGQEIEFCPREYLKIDGQKTKQMRSFQQMWNLQFGDRPDAEIQKRPFFQITNPDDCPPLSDSINRRPGFRTLSPAEEQQRLLREEMQGDAAHHRLTTGQAGPNLYGAATAPVPESPIPSSGSRSIPARGGPVDERGLTARGRMIAQLSGDRIDRPARRGGNADQFEPGATMSGSGRVVSRIPGPPADEAAMIFQQNSNRKS